MKTWSCEHCGRETHDSSSSCPFCLSAMCDLCEGRCDETRMCPSTAPSGVPAASVRDEQILEAASIWSDLDDEERKTLLWHDTHARLPAHLTDARLRLWRRKLLRYDDSAKIKTDLGCRVAAHGRSAQER